MAEEAQPVGTLQERPGLELQPVERKRWSRRAEGAAHGDHVELCLKGGPRSMELCWGSTGRAAARGRPMQEHINKNDPVYNILILCKPLQQQQFEALIFIYILFLNNVITNELNFWLSLKWSNSLTRTLCRFFSTEVFHSISFKIIGFFCLFVLLFY